MRFPFVVLQQRFHVITEERPQVVDLPLQFNLISSLLDELVRKWIFPKLREHFSSVALAYFRTVNKAWKKALNDIPICF